METGLTLTADMVLVLLILTATIGLFVLELVRVDIAAILVMVVIFFGVGKLPAVLGQMGRGVKAFKDGMNDDDLLGDNNSH